MSAGANYNAQLVAEDQILPQKQHEVISTFLPQVTSSTLPRRLEGAGRPTKFARGVFKDSMLEIL